MNPSSTEQLKTIATVLCKMAKFFNQMTELCLLELTGKEHLSNKHRAILNRQNMRNMENSEQLERLKPKEQANQKESQIEKVKNLKPKHPTSSFFFFYREKGQEIAKEKGEVVGSKIAKIVGQLWKGMSQAQRQPYEVKARETRQKYEEEMARYRTKYSNEIAKLKQFKREQKQLKKHKKDLPLLSDQHPQKEQSSYSLGESNAIGTSQVSDQSFVSLSEDMSDSLNLKGSLSPLPSGHSLSSSLKSHESQQQFQVEKEDHEPIVKPFFEQNHQTLERSFQYTKYKHVPLGNKPLPNEKKQLDEKAKSLLNEIKRPKGPISSFLMFYKQQGKRLAQENHLSLGPKTVKLASTIWKKMNAAEKQHYQQLSQQKYRQQTDELNTKIEDDIPEATRSVGMIGIERKMKRNESVDKE